MKKLTSIFFVAILIAGVLISCKKDNSFKDPRGSFEDKTWSGVMFYAGSPSE